MCPELHVHPQLSFIARNPRVDFPETAGYPGLESLGGIVMNRLMLAAAVLGLATTGCASNGMFANRGCRGEACHVARSQSAPRPEIVRASYNQGGCALGGCCGACDATCGCPEPCCGCDDVCCGAGCESGNCLGGYFSRGNGCSDCYDGCYDGCGNGYGNGGGHGGGHGGICQKMVGNIASGCCPHANGYPESYNFNPSPPTGQTAYPYYTVRGPRDFLQNNPPSIGPY